MKVDIYVCTFQKIHIAIINFIVCIFDCTTELKTNQLLTLIKATIFFTLSSIQSLTLNIPVQSTLGYVKKKNESKKTKTIYDILFLFNTKIRASHYVIEIELKIKNNQIYVWCRQYFWRQIVFWQEKNFWDLL